MPPTPEFHQTLTRPVNVPFPSTDQGGGKRCSGKAQRSCCRSMMSTSFKCSTDPRFPAALQSSATPGTDGPVVCAREV